MNKRQVLRGVKLSILKHEYRLENPRSMYKAIQRAIPKLKPEKWACGLCTIYFVERKDDVTGTTYTYCLNCPIYDGSTHCCEEFTRWYNAELNRWRKYWTQKLLNRLYELKLCLENQSCFEVIKRDNLVVQIYGGIDYAIEKWRQNNR